VLLPTPGAPENRVEDPRVSPRPPSTVLSSLECREEHSPGEESMEVRGTICRVEEGVVFNQDRMVEGLTLGLWTFLGARDSLNSEMVLKAWQLGHFPCHLGKLSPQSTQTYPWGIFLEVVESTAKDRSWGLEYARNCEIIVGNK